jgi:WD40 repeat protein
VKHIIAALCAALLLTSIAFAETQVPIVQSGHIDEITRLAFDSDTNTLISISADGTLRAWDSRSRALTSKIQVSSLPIIELVLHPTLPRAAVIESDGLTIHRLSVWDWKNRKRIFSRDIETVPLHLEFSPKGSFLAYSVADWASITIIDAKTGSWLPYLQTGFGIVSSFKISAKEDKVVAYLPSGSIQYRYLRTGAHIADFPTLSNVEDPQFVRDNLYLIGRWEDSLVALDLLTGNDVGNQRLPGFTGFTANPDNGETICYLIPEDDESVGRNLVFTFFGTGFRSKSTRFKPIENVSSNQIVRNNTAYSGSKSGRIFYQTSISTIPRIFSDNRLAKIDDVDITSSVLISTAEKIVTIYSDYLYRPDNTSTADQVLTHMQPNPLEGRTSVFPLASGLYALQDRTGDQGRYWLFSSVEGAVGLPNDSYEYPLLSMDTKDQKILTVDSIGAVRIYDLWRQDFSFSETLFGLQTAIFVQGDSIIAAGRRSQTLGASTLLIDTVTGESVPLEDPSIETFKLVYDPLSHALYTLSLVREGSDTTTVVTEYAGTIFQDSKILFSMQGTHKDATISINRGTLFLSSGGINKALYPGTQRFMPVDGNNNIPILVRVMDQWLISLNRDSSISVWNRARGTHELDFYLFEDYEWVAVTSRGSVLSSVRQTNSYLAYF